MASDEVLRLLSAGPRPSRLAWLLTGAVTGRRLRRALLSRLRILAGLQKVVQGIAPSATIKVTETGVLLFWAESIACPRSRATRPERDGTGFRRENWS